MLEVVAVQQHVEVSEANDEGDADLKELDDR
jgi:hypothetical protein